MDFKKEAFRVAVETRQKAHAPYSKYFVGAALTVKGSDKVFSGCNVENASYGATICAEQTAVVKAVSEMGKIEIDRLMVVTANKNPAGPCGMCLQILSEFCSPETKVLLANPEDGVQKELAFNELLPTQYSAAELEAGRNK